MLIFSIIPYNTVSVGRTAPLFQLSCLERKTWKIKEDAI